MKKRLCMIIIFVCMILFIPVTVSAASKGRVIELENNKTYYYDLDNNGKKEKLKVVSRDIKGTPNEEFCVYIQGKRVFKKIYKGAYVVSAHLLISPKNKTTFFINAFEFWVCDARFYEYRNKKFVETGKAETNYEAYVRSIRIVNINNDKICLQFDKCPLGIGWLSWNVEYQYKNGKWRKVSKYSPTLYSEEGYSTPCEKNKWIANQNFSVYKSVSRKTKAFTMKKNEVFKINKVYTGNSKYLFVQVTRKNGQKGWIRESATSSYSYVKKPMYG